MPPTNDRTLDNSVINEASILEERGVTNVSAEGLQHEEETALIVKSDQSEDKQDKEGENE